VRAFTSTTIDAAQIVCGVIQLAIGGDRPATSPDYALTTLIPA
jgi:hypothetical protein